MTPEQEKYGLAKHEEIASRGQRANSGGLHANPDVPPVLNHTQSFLQRKSGSQPVKDASDTWTGDASSPMTAGNTSN